ncbi:MAG: Pyrophosphatase PpaX [Candidatus Woesearchaeota archaeon]|nr:Pyrophosphatase PpaX [Candidatus Woesearchaeota archaeon]
MLDLLRKLSNYRLAALTTISKEWLEFKKKKFGLDKYFELIVSSGQTKTKKPDPRIYEILLNKLNATAKECVFIDNNKELLLPAQELGMKTIHFTGQKECENKLRDFGIKFG